MFGDPQAVRRARVRCDASRSERALVTGVVSFEASRKRFVQLFSAPHRQSGSLRLVFFSKRGRRASDDSPEAGEQSRTRARRPGCLAARARAVSRTRAPRTATSRLRVPRSCVPNPSAEPELDRAFAVATERAISSPPPTTRGRPARARRGRARGGWLIDAAELQVGAPVVAAGARERLSGRGPRGRRVGFRGRDGSRQRLLGEITLALMALGAVAAKRVRVDTPSRATSFLREVRALARLAPPARPALLRRVSLPPTTAGSSRAPAAAARSSGGCTRAATPTTSRRCCARCAGAASHPWRRGWRSPGRWPARCATCRPPRPRRAQGLEAGERVRAGPSDARKTTPPTRTTREAAKSRRSLLRCRDGETGR